ncbi:MAG: hypothetical protein IID44_06205 [Planctomycetes bacterium]|nr:hypothetical protein [Planctomycetota bacterium]
MLAIFMVTNLNDAGPGSLRQAIWDANDAAGSDVIEFDEAAVGTINLTSGQLNIRDELTINGPGADRLTIDANERSRVFKIFDEDERTNIRVEIASLTITGGRVGDNELGAGILNLEDLTVTDSIISGNTAGAGGGISDDFRYFRSASLAVINSTISGNRALGGGGGILLGGAHFDSALVEIVNSTISDNTASQGGGIFISNYGYGVSVNVTNSTILGNTSDGRGGGILAFSDLGVVEVNVTDSTISDNTSGGRGGGGIYAYSEEARAIVNVTDSTISDNSSSGSGGGILAFSDRGFVNVRVANSTISGNTAGINGGGIDAVAPGDLHVTVANSTISGNTAGDDGGGIAARVFPGNMGLTVTDSILSGNSTVGQIPQDVGGAFQFTGNHSLIGVAASARVTGNGNIADDNPQLAPLADNGGPTKTHALLPGSPAIDAGDPDFVSAGFDQRGAPFARVVNGRIDIGAYEFGASNAADLNGNGFVDFEDLTVLLAAWNQNVSAAEGNLVDADTTPVNFEDLTVLLAAWTGPGAAGAPVGRRLAAAVGGDSVGDSGGTGEAVAVGDASYRRREKAPRQAAAYGSATGVASYRARRAAGRFRPAGESYGRLQAVAVDRAMAEEVTRERIGARRRR